MSVEQRLLNVFAEIDRLEPSPDLFNRVVHSIEEDRRHRTRVRLTAASVVAGLAALIGVGALALRDGTFGSYVHRPTMEALQTIGLVAIAIALGPAIRRFGRGYATDLWPASPTTATVLLRLLDVAYALVVAGYILLTADLTWDTVGRDQLLLAEQIQTAAARTGGLLLLLGLLHGVTLVVLPVLALIDNSTRAGKPLPRWLVVVLILISLPIAFQALMGMIALISIGAGGG